MQNVEVLLKENKSIQFPPEGFSMYPFLNPDKGDQVVLTPFSEREPRVGDVILYRRDGEPGTMDERGYARGILVLHRVCRISGNGYYCVGDNQSLVEGPLRREQLLGVMTARIRGGRLTSERNILYRMYLWTWLLLRPVRDDIKRPIARIKRWVRKKQ